MTSARKSSASAAFVAMSLASAAYAADPEPLPDRTITLVVYGDDACPQPADDEEIVVCARKPESERYRIPKDLRSEGQRQALSWTSRMEDLEAAGRYSMPGGCSVVGSYGQSGCTQQAISQWYRERRAARSRRSR